MAYKYETHMHSSPASRCAKASIAESLAFYRKKGYDGVFLTNHFPFDISAPDPSLSIEQRLDFYCRDYFEGLKVARELGIKLFFGTEMTYRVRTDFLVYGLSPEWYFEHPEIFQMGFPNLLDFLHMHHAFIVHAHPFRERNFFTDICLFPHQIDGVEVVNSHNLPDENKMARLFAEHYKLLPLAGSDNHEGAKETRLSGIITREPVDSEEDFIRLLKSKKYRIFGK